MANCFYPEPIVIKFKQKWREILSLYCWLPFILPIAVFLIVGSFEPKPPDSNGASTSWPSVPYRFYPWIYATKLLATLIALGLVWPDYKPHMRSIGWKGIVVGIVGGVVWITICKWNWEQTTLHPLLKSLRLDSLLGTGLRSAYNPCLELRGNNIGIVIYLAIRGIGLILVVPVMEEYFLRGFVIRYFASDNWWSFPIGQLTVLSAFVGTALPMLMHPGELLAAAVWFSLISILAWHTKNLWECIAAHCTTNLVLGIYVITTGAWWLV